MVSGTRALLFVFESYTEGSRAADSKGTKSCRTQGRISVRAYGRTDVRTDGRMEILPCVLQDFVPFGSTAQKRTFFLVSFPVSFIVSVRKLFIFKKSFKSSFIRDVAGVFSSNSFRQRYIQKLILLKGKKCNIRFS